MSHHAQANPFSLNANVPPHVQTAFSQPPMANTTQAIVSDGVLPAMPQTSTGVVGTTAASNITQFVQQASIAQSSETQLRATRSEDSSKIAQSLSEIAKAQGQSQAAQSLGTMDAVNTLNDIEGTTGGRRGGYIGATRDEAAFNAIGTGKDMEYMERQTGGDRKAAITKADHISDMKTVSSNAAMSLAEDVFGGNAEAFEAVKDAAVVGSALSVIVPGAGKLAGMASGLLGKGLEKIGKVGAVGKSAKGGLEHFNPKNPKDVEEYLDNNRGAKSYTGLKTENENGFGSMKVGDRVTSPKEDHSSKKSDSLYDSLHQSSATNTTMATNPPMTTPKPITSSSDNSNNSITNNPIKNNLAAVADAHNKMSEAFTMKSAASDMMNALDSTSDSELGRSAIKKMASSKLDSLGEDAPKETKARLAQLVNDIDDGGKVSAGQFAKAMDMSPRDFAKEGIVTASGDKGREIDFATSGSVARDELRGEMRMAQEKVMDNANIIMQNAKIQLQGSDFDLKGQAATAGAVLGGSAFGPSGGVPQGIFGGGGNF